MLEGEEDCTVYIEGKGRQRGERRDVISNAGTDESARQGMGELLKLVQRVGKENLYGPF